MFNMCTSGKYGTGPTLGLMLYSIDFGWNLKLAPNTAHENNSP